MALHNNLNLFYLLLLSFSLLLPCHSAPPAVSPSPGPDSSGSPSPGPTSPGPARSPSSSPTPAQGPSQGSGSSPGPSPLSKPALGPSPSSTSALGPSPSSAPAPGPSSDNYVDDDDDNETDTQQDDNSNSPSSSIAPSADAPSGSDSSMQFDFSPYLAPIADADPQVKKICHATDYPPICLATVAPYLNGEIDIPSVLDVAIQASAQYTKYGQTTAHKLAGNPENTPQLNAVLNECSESFGKAMDNYGKASDAIPEHDKSTLNTMLSAIVSSIADCRDANSQDSELYNISDKLIRMTINSLAISGQMA